MVFALHLWRCISTGCLKALWGKGANYLKVEDKKIKIWTIFDIKNIKSIFIALRGQINFLTFCIYQEKHRKYSKITGCLTQGILSPQKMTSGWPEWGQ